MPGTGTLGFHTDNIRISREIFLSPNMTDIWLAIYAKENDISIISMKRSKDWLIQARGEAFQRSIYQNSFQKDTYQTSVVNNVFLVE